MTVKDPDVEILFGGGRIVLNNTGEECEACVYLDCLADKSIVIKCEAGHDDQTHCLSDEQTNALRDWLNSKSENGKEAAMFAMERIKAAYHQARCDAARAGKEAPLWEGLELWMREVMFLSFQAGRRSIEEDAEAVNRYWKRQQDLQKSP